MKKIVRQLKAISDATRLKILKLLQYRSACVCEITAVLGLAQPTISRHLRLLEDAGFVYSVRHGLRMDYALSGNEAPAEVKQLMGLIKTWLENDPEIKRLRNRLQVVAEATCETITNEKDQEKNTIFTREGLA